MNLKTIALVCALASLGAPFSIRAGDVATATPPPPSRGGARELQILTPEEKAKFLAASEATRKDPKVEAARQKMSDAIQEYRASLEASMIATDPSMQVILKKLKEERDKEMAGGAARPAK